MKLRFVKIDPTGNMTVLIRDSVSRAMQPAVAARLMMDSSLGAEQVGFIEPAAHGSEARARLQMMGGEFCGNAAMSLAAVLLRDDGLDRGDVTLEVSGCPGTVTCFIRPGDGGTRGAVSMPLPEAVGTVEGLPAVFLPGIVHLVAPAADFPQKDEAEAFIRRVCGALKAGAAGLLLFDGQAMTMTPCVYVRDTDSAVWERGCASGTAALGAWLALTNGPGEVSLRLPGGIMTARTSCEGGKLTALSVSGGLRVVAEGVVRA